MAQDGIFARKGKPLGMVKIGPDTVGVYGCNQAVYGLINDSRILEAESSKKFAKRSVPVLSMVISQMSKEVPMEIVKKVSPQKNVFDFLLDTIKDNQKGTEMVMRDMVPDEISENSPREMKASENLVKGVVSYKEYLRGVSSSVAEMMDLGKILLRTHIMPTVWGSKQIMASLNESRTGLGTLSSDLGGLEAIMEGSEKRASIVAASLNNPVQKAKLPQIIEPIISGFFNMKHILSSMTESFYPLYSIDGVCKKHAGYPATWFFDSSIFYDFGFNYDNLVKNLIKTAHMESNVIVPLFAWKVSSIGA